MTLAPVLFGLLATVAWGIGDYIGARASKRLSGYTTAFLVLLVATLTFAVVYSLFFRSYTVFDASAITYAAIAGVSFTIGNLAFYRGLELGPVNIVSPLSSLYPLVTALFLLVAFGAQLSPQQGLGIVIVVGGAMIAAGLLQRSTVKKGLSRGPLLAVVAAISYGIAFGLVTQAVEVVGWQLASLIELTAGSLVYLPLLPLLNRGQSAASPARALRSIFNPFVLVAGVLIEVGFLAVTIGIDHAGDLAPTVVAVSACYPVLTVILALKHMKEEFRLVPLIGAFTAIGGIIVLSLG